MNTYKRTMVISLHDGLSINVSDYPELEKLGEWLILKDKNNLRLKTSLSNSDISHEFSQITKINSEKFDVGALSGLLDI